MNIHSVYKIFQEHFRPKRMKEFAACFELEEATTVLDVGGTVFNWNLIPVRPRLTIVNISPPPPDLPDGVTWITTDARVLPFSKDSFDVCFSNSVIEHLGTWEDQQTVAEEIRRVASSYYVQTPNYLFPVEPHLITPFIHWFPRELRRKMLRRFTVWGLVTKPTRAKCESFVREVRLLTRKEMQKLFPDSHIVVEKAFGLPKSFVAIERGRVRV